MECPGGFKSEKMPVPSKLMMKIFIRMLKAKKDKSEESGACGFPVFGV